MDDVTVDKHAELLANRVRKAHRKLRKAFEREGVGGYRLYDWDIPEVRAVVDRYEDHLVVGEYTRQQTEDVPDYPERLAAAVGEALGVPPEHLHARRRQTRPVAGDRYRRLGREGARIEVRERALKFWVHLDDYLDTGLFNDHRDTRAMIGDQSDGARVLNLFGYTGTFTCWAAHGGAKRTVTVDTSGPYLQWARDNLRLNGLDDPRHETVKADVAEWIASAEPGSFDLAIVDPPSFSTRFGARDFDVTRDHPELLARVHRLIAPGGRVLFSTNHQRFEPRLDGLLYRAIEEITEQTVPRDYRNRTIHRAWILQM